VSDAAQVEVSKVVMPGRTNSLGSAFIAVTLAAAALLGLNNTASSAPECLENPDLSAAEPGHWHYRSDRTRNRRCWFFVPADGTAETPVSAPPVTTLGNGSQQLQQTQPNVISDRSGEAPQTILSKPPRSNDQVRRAQPQIASPPATTGAAAKRDLPEPSASNQKQDSPPNDRKALFQDFVKWQLDKTLFGRP
jgi:hypothetical protein